MSKINFVQFYNNFALAIDKYNQVYQRLTANKNRDTSAFEQINSIDFINLILTKIWSNPIKMFEHQMYYYDQQITILNNIHAQFCINEDVDDVYPSDKSDKRFNDITWREHWFFNYVRQSYELWSKIIKRIIIDLDEKDRRKLKKIDFYITQFINALSPSNFALTNPEVIQEIIQTGGKNVVNGLDNLLRDIDKNGKFNITTVNKNKFTLGKNIATTVGKVVFKNELIELINYNPIKENNYQIPLIIVPPCINKFYIMDLSEKNSMIKWLLEQGYNVYLISWVNPDQNMSNITFADYIIKGVVRAIELVKQDCQIDKVNIIGYCIGGLFVLSTAAYLKQSNIQSINSMTLLTTLVDYRHAGDISIFLDEDRLSLIKEFSKKDGYLRGEDMYMLFNILKSHDMIWPFYINNYLLGREPFPFDILAWNSDSTRLPEAMHDFYLTNTYVNNNFSKRKSFKFANCSVDLAEIDIPCYALSAKDDHIAPWRSTYLISKLLGGKVEFVLTGSGHVAGVINHPNKNKYCYWKNSASGECSSKEWFKKSQKFGGSWWLDWHKWALRYSGKKVKSVAPGRRRLKSIGNAPGEYVMQQ